MPSTAVSTTTRPASTSSPVSALDSAGWSRSHSGRLGRQFLGTFLTNWILFGIFFGQGALLARCLGPAGRGEFGAILFFPRDLLLYVSLWGGVEVMTTLAARYRTRRSSLRAAGVRLGIVTGGLAIVTTLLLSAICFWPAGKGNLLPLVALTSLFLPLEHVQLIASGVDRGRGDYGSYNLNRLFFAAVFPILLGLWYILEGRDWWPGQELMLVCLLFIASRLLGLLPTLRDWKADPIEPPATEAAGALAASDLRPRNLLQRGKGFGLSMLATECFERLDVLLIVFWASNSAAGNYFVAIPAATLATLLPNAGGIFAFNAGANPSFQPGRKVVLLMLSGALLVQALTTGLLWGLLPPLIRIVFGPDFEMAISFALWLLPVCGLKGYLQFADGYLKGRGRTLVGVGARCVASACMLTAALLLFPTWKLYAVPIAALLGQILVAAVVTLACLQLGSPQVPEQTCETGGCP